MSKIRNLKLLSLSSSEMENTAGGLMLTCDGVDTSLSVLKQPTPAPTPAPAPTPQPTNRCEGAARFCFPSDGSSSWFAIGTLLAN